MRDKQYLPTDDCYVIDKKGILVDTAEDKLLRPMLYISKFSLRLRGMYFACGDIIKFGNKRFKIVGSGSRCYRALCLDCITDMEIDEMQLSSRSLLFQSTLIIDRWIYTSQENYILSKEKNLRWQK